MERKEPNYLLEMLTSSRNQGAFAVSVIVSALTSIFAGPVAGLVPMVLFAAGEIVAATYIPGMGSFRAKVNHRIRSEALEARQRRLLTEINAANVTEMTGDRARYRNIVARINTMAGWIDDSQFSFSREDHLKLREASGDYLGLWLALIHARARIDSSDESALIRQLDRVRRQLTENPNKNDERRLRKAEADYAEVLDRTKQARYRKTSLEAAMVALHDRIEEIYQMTLTKPGDEGSGLAEALATLKLAEDVETELATEFADYRPTGSARNLTTTINQGA